MHFVANYLQREGTRLDLAAHGLAGRVNYLFLTPRFEASRHVVVLVHAEGEPRPRLVVKVPRRADDTAGIIREGDTLRELARRWPAGRGSIPCVLACEPFDGHHLLVETAVSGRHLNHQAVRDDPGRALATVGDWLAGIPATGTTAQRPGCWEQLLDSPLAGFTRLAPHTRDLGDLVEATQALTAPLREADLPLVVEHGDLSHPNLLIDDAGRLGVVDWELSRPDGLIGHDLFIFLAFAAFARHDAHDLARQRAALDEAFFAPAGWGRAAAEEHLRRRGVGVELLDPLLVTCWARYAAHLLPRLWAASGERPGEPPARDLAGDQLVGDALARSLDVVDRARDVHLWRHVVGRVATADSSWATEQLSN